MKKAIKNCSGKYLINNRFFWVSGKTTKQPSYGMHRTLLVKQEWKGKLKL